MHDLTIVKLDQRICVFLATGEPPRKRVWVAVCFAVCFVDTQLLFTGMLGGGYVSEYLSDTLWAWSSKPLYLHSWSCIADFTSESCGNASA